MNYKPIVIVNGEPNSIFLEIFKAKKNTYYLISSLKLVNFYKKKFKFKKKLVLIDYKNINTKELSNNTINLIDVDFNLQNNIKKFLINQMSL